MTDATEEKKDIKDGQESDATGGKGKDSVDKEAVSLAKGKDSVDKGALSPVPVSPVKNNGEQGNNSVDTEIPVKNNCVSEKSTSSQSSTKMTDSTDSSSTAPTVMTDVQPSKASKEEYAAVFGPQLSLTQEDQT